MAFPSAHLYLRVGGHFGATNTNKLDEWSSGLRFGVVGADVFHDSTKMQIFADAAFTAFFAFHTGTGALAGSQCYMDYITVARIGTDGKYDPPSQLTTRHDGVGSAGVGTIVAPWSTAHVISLRTANPRGYASNGRFYYPMCAAPVTPATGRLTSTQVTNRMSNVVSLFQSLNSAATAYAANMRICVISQVGAGKTAVVTSVRADDRLDSIERRENDQASAWTSFSI